MPTTPALALPYPDPGATPDVPYDMQQLAEAVEDKVPGASVLKGGKRLHWNLYAAATSDALGNVSYTHNAGFTPAVVIALSAAPQSLFPMVWGVHSVTGTAFTVRFCLANGDAAAANMATPAIYALFGE